MKKLVMVCVFLSYTLAIIAKDEPGGNGKSLCPHSSPVGYQCDISDYNLQNCAGATNIMECFSKTDVLHTPFGEPGKWGAVIAINNVKSIPDSCGLCVKSYASCSWSDGLLYCYPDTYSASTDHWKGTFKQAPCE